MTELSDNVFADLMSSEIDLHRHCGVCLLTRKISTLLTIHTWKRLIPSSSKELNKFCGSKEGQIESEDIENILLDCAHLEYLVLLLAPAFDLVDHFCRVESLHLHVLTCEQKALSSKEFQVTWGVSRVLNVVLSYANEIKDFNR